MTSMVYDFAGFVVDNNLIELIQSNLKYLHLQVDHSRRSSKTKKGTVQFGLPRSFSNGSIRLIYSSDWTSGFYAGCLWYMFAYTGNSYWRQLALQETNILEMEKFNNRSHDIGFKMYNSFGNGFRLTKDSRYSVILLESAMTLLGRYNTKVGAIKSWDFNTKEWRFPVIIDSMMNLELLFWAHKQSGNQVFYDVAVSHANRVMANHFRQDSSSFHVVDYDERSGSVRKKMTYQGYSDSSGKISIQCHRLREWTLGSFLIYF